MIISFRNINLSEIGVSDLESLRKLRNENRELLINNTEIDENNQKAWFHALDKEKNTYYTIKKDKVLLGFIFVKNLDENEMSFETGVLILNEFKGSSAVAIAAMILSFYYFFIKKYNLALANIHKDNHQALEFNKSLKFEVLGLDGDFYKLRCSNNEYLSLLDKLSLTNKFKREIKIILDEA
jgi:hypothetical protein